MVTVNGSSQQEPVSCSDRSVHLKSVEVLSPPEITAQCNRTHALMRWSMRSLFPRTFTYHLEIRQSSTFVSNTTVSDPGPDTP
ncbi:interleukin-3 receptor subunit alpha-like, partial [Nannospalax galili]|uniref:interleukin-3 receptor subunit alpha-like n=1 Tax=Nannospalax galili TaxID=1026970 RepID=UPI000819F151